MLALTTPGNPLGRPCQLTRQLAGAPLTALLKGVAQGAPAAFAALLETAGDYRRRIHAITFPFPGYVVGDGPAAPLAGAGGAVGRAVVPHVSSCRNRRERTRSVAAAMSAGKPISSSSGIAFLPR